MIAELSPEEQAQLDGLQTNNIQVAEARKEIRRLLPKIAINTATTPPQARVMVDSHVDGALASVTARAEQAARVYFKQLGDRAMLFIVVIAGLTIAITSYMTGMSWSPSLTALTSAAAVWVIIHWAIWLWFREKGGFLLVIRGVDNRLSTSKAQAALWTSLLSFAYLLFAARLVWGVTSDGAFVASTAEFDPKYLFLLGGPFAAAALARYITQQKDASGEVQKTIADGPQLRDLVSDDAGDVSLNDLQFFVFNLTAVGFFVALLAKTPDAMPQLPDTLVGLTSVSALAYVTNKAVTSNPPVIASIVRASSNGLVTAPIKIGTDIEIRGLNFVPPGATDLEQLRLVTVRFGALDVPVTVAARDDGKLNPNDRSVLVQVPDLGQNATSVDVSIVTAAGLESNIRTVSIEP